MAPESQPPQTQDATLRLQTKTLIQNVQNVKRAVMTTQDAAKFFDINEVTKKKLERHYVSDVRGSERSVFHTMLTIAMSRAEDTVPNTRSLLSPSIVFYCR